MLVVLEGLDGSGKSTQLALLRAWLAAQGLPPVMIKAPDYEDESSVLVRQYLGGRFGSRPEDVGAYAASAFYAVDRYASFRTKWSEDYRAGRIILADRYTTSNAYHQAAKLPAAQWPGFFDWLEDFEYGKLGIPRPDLVLFLDMPPQLSWALVARRYEGNEQRRDIHEADRTYLLACRETALAAAAALGWEVVPCVRGTNPLTPEEIHEDIRARVWRHIR
jgi:dTMP kinase